MGVDGRCAGHVEGSIEVEIEVVVVVVSGREGHATTDGDAHDGEEEVLEIHGCRLVGLLKKLVQYLCCSCNCLF